MKAYFLSILFTITAFFTVPVEATDVQRFELNLEEMLPEQAPFKSIWRLPPSNT